MMSVFLRADILNRLSEVSLSLGPRQRWSGVPSKRNLTPQASGEARWGPDTDVSSHP